MNPQTKAVSRRHFSLLAPYCAAGGFLAAQLPISGAGQVSAKEVVRQIQDKLGGSWPESSLDGFKAGNADLPVTGIATTAMATLQVLQKAAKAKLNLILTNEPTFYGRQDGPALPPTPGGRGRGPAGVLPTDPVYQAKREFIEKNGLVVFRLRDHWVARPEKHMTLGLAETLGWSRYAVAGEGLYEIPEASAEEVVAMVRRKMGLKGGLRAVGDRKARVKRVMLQPGLMAVATMWKHYHDVDLLLTGEVREWECTFYAADMFSAGEKRNLVTVGRVASEEPGMQACAKWLSSAIQGVPAKWLDAGDPYWRAV